MNRGDFSWKRFLGVSGAKSRVLRKIGIPLTKSGRQRKVGRVVTGEGCLLQLLRPALGIRTPCSQLRIEQSEELLRLGLATVILKDLHGPWRVRGDHEPAHIIRRSDRLRIEDTLGLGANGVLGHDAAYGAVPVRQREATGNLTRQDVELRL